MSLGAQLPVFIIGIVFFFVYQMVRLSAKERDDKRRIDLVEKAMEKGDLDAATKRQLVQAVVGESPRWSPLLVIGWLGLCVGLGMLAVACLSYGNERMFQQAILVTCGGFGLLSLPIAMRELGKMQATRSVSGGES